MVVNLPAGHLLRGRLQERPAECRAPSLQRRTSPTVTTCLQVTCCAVDPGSDQLTAVHLPPSATLEEAAQRLGQELTDEDAAVQQFWVNLEAGDDLPRLPYGDPIFEINLVLLSARPGGKR